jgi:hypothetical protein
MHKIRELFEKLKYRERVLAFAVLAAVAFLSANFLVVGELRRMIEVQAEKSALVEETEKLKAEIAALGTPKPDDARRNPLWRYRRGNKGLAGLVTSVTSREENRKDFTVRRISSEKVERTDDFEKTTLQIEVEAPFNSLGAFLEDLEKSDLLTRVEAVQISRPEKEMNLCKARILLNSFIWRDL